MRINLNTIWTRYKASSIKVRWVLLSIAILLLLENAVLFYDNLQNKTPIFGLKLDGQDLTGLSRSDIEQVIKKEIEKNKRPLKLSYQDRMFEITADQIGAQVDLAVATNKLIARGRQGSFWQKILEQNKAIFGLVDENLAVNISQTSLNLKLLQIQSEVNQEATPIMPDFTGDINKTFPAKNGVKLNTSKLTILIADNIFDPPSLAISIPIIKTFTDYNEEELATIRKQGLKLIKGPISIKSGGIVFTLTPADLKSMLTVVERPDPRNPRKLVLSLRLDDQKLNRKLGEFAEKVEQNTHAEFDDHDARVAIYAQLYSSNPGVITIPTGRNLANLTVLGAQTNEGSKKIAYLTFDDGPNSIYHPMILDILKSYNIRATFFLVGQNALRDSEVAKRTAAEGHRIGNHSNTHSFLPNLPSERIFKELKIATDILKPINANQDINLFRPPYGGVNLSVKNYADQLHMKLYLWDVDPRDWSEPAVDDLVNRVVSNTQNGSDILLHSNHLVTVKALPKMIEALKALGYSFDTLN